MKDNSGIGVNFNMKQRITLKQWDSISKKKKIFLNSTAIFCSRVSSEKGIYFREEEYPNIGQMIEFLGDDWVCDIGQAYDMDMESFSPELYYQYEPDSLCDALWEAVKYKLKNDKN